MPGNKSHSSRHGKSRRSSGSSCPYERSTPQPQAIPLPLDPYKELGVPNDADAATIRTAYRRLALVHHPDKVTDPSRKAASAEKFRQIQEAYELLTDETRLTEYKAQLRYAAGGGRPSVPPRLNQNAPRPGQNVPPTGQPWYWYWSTASENDPLAGLGAQGASWAREEAAKRAWIAEEGRRNARVAEEARRASAALDERIRRAAAAEEDARRSSAAEEERRARAAEAERSSSGSGNPRGRTSATFPLRPYYTRCDVCNCSNCAHVHRWFTRLGYIRDLMRRGVSVEAALELSTDRFGPITDEVRRCETCGVQNCVRIHRMFTREGFIWDLLRARGGDPDRDAVLDARFKARAEFSDAPTDRNAPPSSGYSYVRPPRTSSFSSPQWASESSQYLAGESERSSRLTQSEVDLIVHEAFRERFGGGDGGDWFSSSPSRGTGRYGSSSYRSTGRYDDGDRYGASSCRGRYGDNNDSYSYSYRY